MTIGKRTGIIGNVVAINKSSLTGALDEVVSSVAKFIRRNLVRCFRKIKIKKLLTSNKKHDIMSKLLLRKELWEKKKSIDKQQKMC